ncbi:MAG: hypothetical protein ACI8W8_005113 [Rhodothermales bacterium]|jgi:hypothetical protein
MATEAELSPALLAAARDAQQAFTALLAEAAREAGLAESAEFPPETGLHLRLHQSPDELAESARRLAADLAAEACEVRTGFVYCYHCNSASCEHAAPPEPGHVFAAYQESGRPEWREFFHYLVDLEDERVDELFLDSPPALARVVGRKSIIDRQLVSFGRGSLTYHIVGQVAGGYIRVNRQQHAFTLQAVETRDRSIRCQLIGNDDLRDALTSPPGKHNRFLNRIYDALHSTRRQIEGMNPGWKHAATKAERKANRERIFAILRHLAQSIERQGRQAIRRTGHAEERAADRRPVHTAVGDLAAASATDFFHDTVRQSIVVAGRSGRVHVFNKNGRHITSLVIARDKLERLCARKRYVPLTIAEQTEFREAVATI